MNIAVLGSTRGTDLQAVIDAIEKNTLKDVKISFVLSNNKDAYILERAKKHKIKTIFIDSKDKSREDFDALVEKELHKHKIDLILLIGYMRYLSTDFVDLFRNMIMNIHPSLLPAFAGGMDINVHKEVLDWGCKVSGCTLNFVDEGEDTGPIILQKAVQIEEDETVESLKEKVQDAEQEIIIRGIELYRDGRIKVEGRSVRIFNR